jgi:hypothetical protein
LTDTTLPDPLVPAAAHEFDSAWRLYEGRKAVYLERKPAATPEEVEAFCADLAEEFGL